MLQSSWLSALGLAALLLLPSAAMSQDPAATPAEPATTPEPAAPAGPTKAIIHTNMGAMTIELFADKAPKSVANFLEYAQAGHYNGTIFHRVIDGFMIQGGGYTADLQLKPMRPAIENEAKNGLSNLRGTLAMARTSEPHSAQSQFFINVVDNPRLDFVSEQSGYTWGYAVFAKVTDGLDVVDRIRSLETGAQGPMSRDVPLQTVLIERVEVIPPPAVEPAPAAPTDPAAATTPADGN